MAATLNVQLDAMYQPLRTQVALSGTAEPELKGTYEFGTSYNPDGTVAAQRLPAAGGLPAETLDYVYDDLQRPTRLNTTLGDQPTGTYVSQAAYAPTSQLQRLTLGPTGGSGTRTAQLSYEYERGTDRLTNSSVYTADTDLLYDADYTYDESGNVTSIADTPKNGQADVQCFRYDWQRRLKTAWATALSSDGAAGTSKQNAACAPDPTRATLGGPGAYWQDFAYDTAGNRSQQTLHGVGGRPDVTRTYTYGEDSSGDGGPHTLTKVVQETPASGAGPAVTSQDTYEYDQAGNTERRVLNGTTTDLRWNVEGGLARASKGGGQDTAYLADPSGARLLRKAPGKHTLYLPGMELALDTSSRAVEATRYYTFAGQTVALRTAKGVQLLAGDHHGTMSLALDAASGQVTRRRLDPFGNGRDLAPGGGSWVDDKGFLNKPVDAATGLTNIGAREYEPENGRFISADPLIDFTDPQQINGYAYANNNPVTQSDPSGEAPIDCALIGVSCAKNDKGGFDVKTTDAYEEYHGVGKTDTEKRAESARAQANHESSTAKSTAKALAKLVGEELGISDALDCFTTGSLGSCGNTAIGVLTNLGPAKIAKLLKKYALHPRKLAVLVKRTVGLIDKLKDSFQRWRKLDKKADELEDAARRECLSNSFTPDTKVLMADGRTKAIKDVKVGDRVVTTDPKTGKKRIRTVTAEIKGEGAKHLVKVTIDVDGGKGTRTSSITATGGHPFWVPKLNRWLDATDLHPGQWLRTSAGTLVQITAVERWTQRAGVHNLTVADVHTYYVLAGQTPVLIHNSNGCPNGKLSDPLPQGMSRHFVNAYDEIRAGRGVPQTDPATGAQKVFQGRATHEKRWAGALEYRVPGSKGDSARILAKTLPDGRVVMGWTNDHYKTIKPFSAPHFPDSGW
ncbi:polymorphic toxin-type HINT domain-containing protein [Streptomyces sp. G45]|uniref:polymorphic toxin-type HINT domain-containing protein n=1 Tax=Streptomyces sp. G45 TaxID=3406627 RepID=UPI003C24B346